MPYGLYISAEGAAAQSRRLEVISNNLANADTTGFKRQLATVQARDAEAVTRGYDYIGSGTINDVGGGVQVHSTATDHSLGVLKATGVPSDVAIVGDGYFQVQAGDRRLLTRAGNFAVNPLGQITTPSGHPVLSNTGEPVQIALGGGDWEISAAGEVLQGGERIPLAIVAPPDVNALVHEGQNFFSTPQGVEATPLPLAQRNVRVGFLEGSGVEPISELMSLITASRAYEANVRLMQHQDEAMGSLISRILHTA